MGKQDLSLRKERKQRQHEYVLSAGKTYQEGNYEIQKIIDMRIIKGHRQYLIKWKGYSIRYNTWEPVNNLLTISGDILKFQQDKKQYVKQIQTKWNQLFQKGKVTEPLQTNELSKMKRYLKKSQMSHDQFKKKKDQRLKKINKFVEIKQGEDSNSRIKKKQFDQQKCAIKTRKLRAICNLSSKIINNEQEEINQNQSELISSFSVSNFSSQILNSCLFQENKCQTLLNPPQAKNFEPQSSPSISQKPDFSEEFMGCGKRYKACKKVQKKQQFEKKVVQYCLNKQQVSQNTINKFDNISQQPTKKQSWGQYLIKNQAAQQIQNSKESTFKLSNYLIQTPKKSIVFSSNSPIERSLNKYIYRGKLKNNNVSNEKEKKIQTIPQLQLHVKQLLSDIISQKAQVFQDSKYMKKDQSQNELQQKKMDFYSISQKLQQEIQEEVNQEIKKQIVNCDESKKQKEYVIPQNRESSQLKKVQQFVQLNSNEEQKQKKKQIQSKFIQQVKIQVRKQNEVNLRKNQQLQSYFYKQLKANQLNFQQDQALSISPDPSQFSEKKELQNEKKKEYDNWQLNTLYEQVHRDENSMILFDKNYQNLQSIKQSNEDKQHKKVINIVQSEVSESAQISSEKPSYKSKKHFYPRLIHQNINTSQLTPKIKKIIKPFKTTKIRSHKKQKDNDSQNEKEANLNYNLSELLTNSISFEEIRLRNLKLVKIIRIFKFQTCTIFIVLVRNGNELVQRFMVYTLMRDFYPRLLLRYLQQNGKLEI